MRILLLHLCLTILLPYLPLMGQEHTTVLRRAILHRGDGTDAQQGIIAFKEGKILYVGPASGWTAPEKTRWIDVQRRHVYPGLIAPNTTLGLREYEQVRATNDFREIGEINTNIRSIIAYNTESDVIPTLRSNGILYAQITPEGGWISGRSSVVQLTGHNWEDAVVQADNGLHVHWPSDHIHQGWWGDPKPDKPNKHYQEQRQKILQYFHNASAWCNAPDKPNIKLKALCSLRKKNGILFIHADRPFEIKDAITSLTFLDLPMVIVGGKEAWRISAFLREYQVSVIYIKPHALPQRRDDPLQLPYDIPRRLDSAGVHYCLGVDGFWQVRNLPFMAGQAAAMGLPIEKAIQSITSSTASILGIGEKTGTLKAGMSADIIVSEGDLLDMSTSSITRAYLRGQRVDLSNKQKELYDKYRKRYNLK